MTQKELYSTTLNYLEANCPQIDTELAHHSPFQLLVAVVLSAQCTDERVNKVTPALFREYPDAFSMSQASEQNILEFIHSVSYPNSKSKYLIELSKKLAKDYQGEVPSTIEELVSLPGVGRKTANVIQAIVFHKAALAVDTHVFRVSHRIGLVKKSATTPLAVEKELTKNIQTKQVSAAHFWLLYHGRYTCTARKPHCEKCGLTSTCKYFNKK